MARRNRKNGHEGSRVVFWGVPIMALAAALGFVYLHLHGVCDGIGREINRLEQEHAELRKRVVNEERNWVAARYFPNMEVLMARHGIEMSFPEERNIIRIHLRDSAEPPLYAYQGGVTRRD